jgi:hypothetical protein
MTTDNYIILLLKLRIFYMSYAPQIFKVFRYKKICRFLTNLSIRSNFVRTYFAFGLISHNSEQFRSDLFRVRTYFAFGGRDIRTKMFRRKISFGDWAFGDWAFGDWAFGDWAFGV